MRKHPEHACGDPLSHNYLDADSEVCTTGSFSEEGIVDAIKSRASEALSEYEDDFVSSSEA